MSSSVDPAVVESQWSAGNLAHEKYGWGFSNFPFRAFVWTSHERYPLDDIVRELGDRGFTKESAAEFFRSISWPDWKPPVGDEEPDTENDAWWSWLDWSVGKDGVQEPIILYRLPSGEMDVGDGWHRFAAAVKHGLRFIPVILGEPKTERRATPNPPLGAPWLTPRLAARLYDLERQQINCRTRLYGRSHGERVCQTAPQAAVGMIYDATEDDGMLLENGMVNGVNHWWIRMSDGTVVDVASSQFGQRSPLVIPPGHPMQRSYVADHALKAIIEDDEDDLDDEDGDLDDEDDLDNEEV